MSTLRITNIEAKGDPSSPSTDEKVKIKDSTGNVILEVDGKAGAGQTVFVSAGIVTATSFSGDGSGLSGIDATSLKDSGGNIKVQANTSGAVVTGIATATSFSGNLTGNADSSTTAQGLTGTPNVVVGIVTASEISGGIVTATTLTVNGNNYPSAGPLSNRNLIINGDMRIAQRGTSTSTSGHFAIDRFRCSFSNLSITTSRENLTSGDPYDGGFRFFTRMTNSAASSANNTFVQLDYPVEAQDMAMCGWNYTNTNSFISVQFWVRSSLAGEYYIQLRAYDGGEDYWNHPFNLAANTWTKVEYQVPGNAMVTFNNDNGVGLEVNIVPHYGTDFTGATAQENAWFTRSGFDWFPDFDQDWGNTTGTFDVTGLQIEVGEVATPFEHRSFGDELVRCQRYYQQINGDVTGSRFANGFNVSTTQADFHYDFPTKMRASVTGINQSGDGTDYSVARLTGSTTCNAVPIFVNGNTHSADFRFNVASGLTAGQGVIARAANTDAFIGFSAEL